MRAIDTLLVTDHLFHAADFADRQKYIALADSVRDCNGQVLVLTMNVMSSTMLYIMMSQ